MYLRRGITLILVPFVFFAVVTIANAQRRKATAGIQIKPFTYVIDSTIQPREALAARPGETAQRVATLFEPKGMRQDFVVDELIIRPRSDRELREFLRTYNGKVVDDGKIPPLPPGVRSLSKGAAGPDKTGLVVVKVDLSRAPLSRLVENARRLRVGGEFRFSSEAAARLSAIIMEERVRGRTIAIDLVFQPQSTRQPCRAKSTFEHAARANAPVLGLPNLGFRTAFAFPYLDDSDIGVTNAWDMLDRSGHASEKVLLFIIDGGFAPNADFRSTTYQYNFVNNTYNAVGSNQGTCGSPCPWHGTEAFSTAGAVINNRFGAAGTGGQVVEPVLFATRYKFSEAARAVRTATSWATRHLRLPAVINMSFSGHCGFFCTTRGLDDAIEEAVDEGLIPVAAAGNDNEDAEDNDVYPCKESGVICVGAIGRDKRRASFSNYGSGVDIWAPGVGVTTTPNPASGAAPGMDLPLSNGTSFASPFVAGIVAMMKAIDRSITSDQVRGLLRTQSTPSADPKVNPGFVNAHKAIARTLAGHTPHRATRFLGTGVKWHDYFGYRNEFVSVGDFNGDCRDDIITFTKGTAGEVFVALSDGSRFEGSAWRWGIGICVGNQTCAIGDFTGDRRDDIAVIDHDTGTVRVAVSTGSNFLTPTEWLNWFSKRRGQTVVVGNFGYHTADDLALFVHGNDPSTLAPGETRGQVYVALSDGTRFMQRDVWHSFFAPGPEKVASGDFNGDGLNDIAAFLQSCCPEPSKGDLFVALSGVTSFYNSANWHNYFSLGTEVPAVGNFNGDSTYDVLSFAHGSPTSTPGVVKVGLSGPSSRIELVGDWHRNFCHGSQVCLTGDFNGDNRSDIVAFTLGETGDVYVALSSL